MIVGNADAGEGGSVRRYNESIEETTDAADDRPTCSIGTITLGRAKKKFDDQRAAKILCGP